MLLDSIVLREVCENIFEDLNNLVKARNNQVHTKNYEDKWIALREVVDKVFCDLQRSSVEAQNQPLKNWFKEVITNMEAVEVRMNRLYISDSPFFLDLSSIITSSVKENMDTSWLTQVYVKPQISFLEKLKMHDPVEDKKVEKLEQEEKKEREEAQARRSEALEENVKKQSEDLKAMMIYMMAMMKKQQQP